MIHHSVILDEEKCKGCINCIKRCPTEAIRVRNGKATIIEERCIDCGQCIKVCPQRAKKAKYDPFEIIDNFKYKIALPAPSFYAQFHNMPGIDGILYGLKLIGFDDCFEVALAAQAISNYTQKLLDENPSLPKPVISSACPAVVKLIRIRFPNLIENVLHIMAPVELAAKTAREEAVIKTGLKADEIGVFFISPCAAKITTSKWPIGFEKPLIDGILSMSEVYKRLLSVLKYIKDPPKLSKASYKGIGWAMIGGESTSLKTGNYISADGIENIINVLEKIEDEKKLKGVEFVELNNCSVGCLGGCLTVEDPYVAKSRLGRILKDEIGSDAEMNFGDELKWDLPLEYSPVMRLDDNMSQAIKKMGMIGEITQSLPGLDCGSCGAPSCRSLAEDIVNGIATADDCIFKLGERIRHLMTEMQVLQDYMPPPFRESGNKKTKKTKRERTIE